MSKRDVPFAFSGNNGWRLASRLRVHRYAFDVHSFQRNLESHRVGCRSVRLQWQFDVQLKSDGLDADLRSIDHTLQKIGQEGWER
jgi:hypothetical protein